MSVVIVVVVVAVCLLRLPSGRSGGSKAEVESVQPRERKRRRGLFSLAGAAAGKREMRDRKRHLERMRDLGGLNWF